MIAMGLNLEGVVFRYAEDNYLAHSDCADKVLSSMPLGSVVIIGPVEWTEGDRCAYANCDKQ